MKTNTSIRKTRIQGPYYVTTPRNCYGEHTTFAPYTVRATHAKGVIFHECAGRAEADMAEGYLNQDHNTQLCYAAGI